MTRVLTIAALVAVAATLAGCGGGSRQTTTTTTPAPPEQTVAVRIYLLLDGKVQPVARDVSASVEPANGAFGALLGGPTPDEQARGLATAMPKTASYTVKRTPAGLLDVSTGALQPRALAQAVYTLTQFPQAETVIVNGKQYSRASFEDDTPAILVEAPLPGAKVTTPLRAKGTANTFEATFQYDLRDAAGKLLKTHFVTATSGTGTRGTFAFRVPFTVAKPGPGTLVVYELSAKDGSRINEIAIPVQLG